MIKKLIKIITKEEFEKLFEAATKLEANAKRQSRKDKIRAYRVAMLLGFEAGMRISEIVGYKGMSKGKNNKGEIIVAEVNIPPLSKPNIGTASIKIMGKGSKERMVPRPKRLNSKAVAMLPLKIKRRALQGFITELALKELKKHISFHTLRHGFGSHLANVADRPLHEIQMLMGHTRISTTGIYLHANPKKALEGAREAF